MILNFLLDFLGTEGKCRTAQLSYVNLTRSYLTAFQSTKLCHGREVIA